jgi:hypothetical protein
MTGERRWHWQSPAGLTELVPLVVPTWANQGWRHRVGGDGLLALAAGATVLTALSGAPVGDLVPTLVLLPWLALWSMPSWFGFGLAAANFAIAVLWGVLDTSTIAVVGGLWLVLLIVWFQNQGWLPWVFLLAWCAWGLASGAQVWTQRDGASLAELGVGLLALAWLWQLARAHRPQAPRWHAWRRGAARGEATRRTPRLAIAGAAVAVELSWLLGRPSPWAVAIAVLLPWILLGWLTSDPRSSVATWARWAVVSATTLFLVIWSQSLVGLERELDLIALCGLLWGGLAFGWMLSGRWRRRLLSGGAAVGLSVAVVGWGQAQPPRLGLAAAAILALVGVAIIVRLIATTRERQHAWLIGTDSAFDPDHSILAVPFDNGASDARINYAPQPSWVRATPGALLAGKQAEAAMRQLMLVRLPAGTWVLSQLTLPGLRGDLDLLVIGATGVFVFEVKFWAGRIMCGGDGHAWTRQRRGLIEIVSDPAGQLQREISAAEHFLRHHNSATHDVGAALIFAHPRCEVEAAACPVPVLAPQDVEAMVRAGLPGPRLSASEQARLAEQIASVQPSTWDRDGGMAQAWGPL